MDPQDATLPLFSVLFGILGCFLPPFGLFSCLFLLQKVFPAETFLGLEPIGINNQLIQLTFLSKFVISTPSQNDNSNIVTVFKFSTIPIDDKHQQNYEWNSVSHIDLTETLKQLKRSRASRLRVVTRYYNEANPIIQNH